MAIVTLDNGFARIYRHEKGSLTVILIKAIPSTPANIIQNLKSAHDKINLKEIENKLVIITKNKIRIIT